MTCCAAGSPAAAAAETSSPRTLSGSPPAQPDHLAQAPRQRGLPGQHAEPGAGGEALPAAAAAARARRAGRVHHHVADLAGEARRTRPGRGRRSTMPPPMPVPSVTMTTWS